MKSECLIENIGHEMIDRSECHEPYLVTEHTKELKQVHVMIDRSECY
jgi:hypothetical protein